MTRTTKPKASIDNLVIEITRRCNMCCDHCLRGDAQDVNIQFDTLKSLFARLNHIREITFTGGEPSLNPGAMMDALRLCKKYGVSVETIWLATNGKEVSDGFIKACHAWNRWTTEKYFENTSWSGSDVLKRILKNRAEAEYIEREYGCYVAVSLDMFHDNISPESLARLLTLPNLVPDKAHIYDKPGDTRWVMGEGRAYWNGLAESVEHDPVRGSEFNEDYAGIDIEIERDGNCRIEQLYISSDGSLMRLCDYSYDDMPRFTRGTITGPDWLDELVKTEYDGEE